MASSVSRPRARTRLLRLYIGCVALVFGLSACTGGPGNEEDLVAALTRDDTFTTPEAECIAAAVFAEYGENEDAIGKISDSASYEDIIGVDGVEDFDSFFTGAVRACTNT